MPAAAARLGVAGQPPAAVGQMDLGVTPGGGKPVTVGNPERDAVPHHLRTGLDRPRIAGLRDRAPEPGQRVFEFSAPHRIGAERPQVIAVRGGVETVHGQVGSWIERAQPGNEARREPGRRVHRHVDGNQIGAGGRGLIQRIERRVVERDLEPFLAQPGRRRGEAERRVAEIVGRDQQRRSRSGRGGAGVGSAPARSIVRVRAAPRRRSHE